MEKQYSPGIVFYSLKVLPKGQWKSSAYVGRKQEWFEIGTNALED